MVAWYESPAEDDERPTLYGPNGKIIPFTVQKADGFGDAGSYSVPQARDPQTDDLSRYGPYAAKRSQYDLYRHHPVVYAAVELIQQTASADMPNYSDEKHPLVPPLEAFFANVGDATDMRSIARNFYRDLAIGGEAFILKQRKGVAVSAPGAPTRQRRKANGAVVGLRRLIGSITVPVVDPKSGEIKWIEQKIVGQSATRKFDPKDVIFGKLDDPDSEHRGLSPLVALDLTLGTDLQAARAFNAYFMHGMQAGRVFKMQKGTREQGERNKDWIMNTYTRPENAYKPMLLLGDIDEVPGKAQQMDMPFLNGREHAINLVCAVYSIPRSKLFPELKGALGQAAHETDDVTFRRDTIGPYQGIFVGRVNTGLMDAEFHTGDLHLEPPMQQVIYLDRGEVAQSAVQTGWTGNEVRTKIYNLAPIENDESMEKPLYLIRGVDVSGDLAAEGDAAAEAVAKELQPPDPEQPRPKVGRRNAVKAALRRVLKADDGEDDDDEPDEAPPSREKQRRAAAIVHNGTVRAGATFAALLHSYAAGKLSRHGLEQALDEDQVANIARGIRQAAVLTGNEAGDVDVYSGPSLNRLLSIADRMAAGLISPDQAEAWARAEAGEAWRVFNRQRVERADPGTWLVWSTDPAADSCQDCIGLDGEIRRVENWDTFPGEQQCGVNCRCSLDETDPPKDGRE